MDSEPVTLRLPREILEAADEFRKTEDDQPNRPEAIRRVLRDTLPEKDQPVKPASKKYKILTAEEDAAINAYYASGQPGVGAQFLKAMIRHLRAELRSNPDITVEEVKDFVLDVFDDYGQPLDEHEYRPD